MEDLRQLNGSDYYFDDVVVERGNFRVCKDGQAKSLTPRAFDVLVYLIERRGRVVEKQELFEAIWKETFVTDNALTRAVKEIRRELGDNAAAPRYVETVHKRGYRFIAELSEREVENLPESFDDAENLLENPAVEDDAGLIVEKSAKPESGDQITHYEIISSIGEGGMGEVYLAKDTRLNRKVALKLLAAHVSEDKTKVSRFRQEAFATSALNHPNIITIYEIGEWHGRNFIAAEFIDGITLRSFLRKKKLSIGEALEIALQIASALAAAHGAGIVHRDIKPENIMIRPDGLVKVLDFGIAKYKPTEKGQKALVETEIGEVIGTAAYMSPEQARGLEIDERADVWSLGVILYEMIARKLPFEGKTKSDRIAAILEREPAPLTKNRRGAPPKLEQIVSRALAKEKKERYEKMADIAEDLNRLRETIGDKRPSALILPTRKSAAPRRAYLFAAFTALLVGTIGFILYFWSANKTNSGADGIKSLAVLPFVNAAGDANAEYLSDGITESVINNLSQIAGLKVMSRNSAFRFKNNQTDTKNIAAQLGVESLVTGDIRQIGDKFVINVRLIDAGDDSQIWGSQYIKTSSDIIAVQNEIAQAVVRNLHLKLTSVERQQLGKSYTKNPEAYQLYLKGRYHMLKITPPEMRKSIEFSRQATDADPTYALAYVGLADAYRLLSINGEMPPDEAFPKAKAALSRALEIDETLAEAHSSSGSVKFWFDWDWQGAEAEFRRANELAPNNALARPSYASFLSNMGRFDEALAEIEKARERDPLSLTANSLEGLFLFYAGRDREAIVRLQKTFEIEPKFWFAHLNLAKIYIRQKRFDEALSELNAAGEFSAGNTETISLIGYTLAVSGRREQAEAALDELKKMSAQKYVPSYHIALIYNGLDKTGETFDWLEKAFRERDVYLSFIKVDPKWENARSDSRFVSLLKRMNLE